MNIFGKKNKDKKNTKSGPIESPKATALNLNSGAVLGVPLCEAVSNNRCYDGVPVPRIVRKCIDFVTRQGMHVEGIYRVSCAKSRLDELENSLNNGNDPVFSEPNEAAGLLKRFLRQLPDHILTDQLKPKFDVMAASCRCNENGACSCSAANGLNQLLRCLPKENHHLLGYVFIHAKAVVQQEKFNKMSLSGLGVILQATLNLTRNQVRIFLFNCRSAENNANDLIHEQNNTTHSQLFDDVDFKTYLEPRPFNELKLQLPHNENEINEELFRQQNLLKHLHEQVEKSVPHASNNIEQRISETQASIKLLRAKLNLNNGTKCGPHETVEAPHMDNRISVANGTDNTSELPTDISPALLEKQLIAVQSSLQEEISMEKRAIACLLTRLREIHAQLPPHLRHQRKPSNEDQGNTEKNKAQEALLESRRDELVLEVARLRNLCATLRAQLERDTVLLDSLNNAAIQQKNALTGPMKPTEPRTNSAQGNSQIIESNDKQKAVTKNDDAAAQALLVTRF
ncbi:rhoGAP domain-containing protein [Ditylenchus destructor]|uniref:RhoGAP domain-containing protein n=1 Tax=Ditylenchus destructor TaxID=166010 RepID=A0AAD4R0V4_9BILA|nr:rhoGAP domain-containing protein [Ditylenchus destructor]